MKLNYTKNNSKLVSATKWANQILEDPNFYLKIIEYESFTNAAITPQEIALELGDFNKTVNIRTWWNPFSKANAKTGGSSFIKINTAKLKRSQKSIVNTIIHEYVHAVDFASGTPLRYTHVDNNNDGEENNTAPWAIGKIAENMV